MKKLLGILVLGLLWCNTSFAFTQESVINNYLSNKKLEKVEGIFVHDKGGRVIAIYKSGGTYYNRVISSRQVSVGSTNVNNFTKAGSNVFHGDMPCQYKDSNQGIITTTCDTTIIATDYNLRESWSYDISQMPNWQGQTHYTDTWSRIWPENFIAHNAKFKTKKDIADEEKVVAVMVADARKICKVLGFKDGSDKFADCTLKLYTQKVDELVAEKQAAADTRMTQSQTGTTTQQSSGSSSVTIYDPVRDSRALMKQGQKMLSGQCTFGIDC